MRDPITSMINSKHCPVKECAYYEWCIDTEKESWKLCHTYLEKLAEARAFHSAETWSK